MTRIGQLRQLHALRQSKLDQLMRIAGRAAAHLAEQRAYLDACAARHVALIEACEVPFQTRFLAANDIPDPHSRLVAVNTAILRDRAHAIEAKAKRQEAAGFVKAAETELAKANRNILAAQGRLTGSETLLEQAVSVEAIREEANEDEAALDQFAARAAGGLS